MITGAAHGAGRALAFECGARGMHVVVADIDGDAAHEVAREVDSDGGRAIAVPVDVADLASVEALAERAYTEYGEVNVLFNNAGVLLSRRLADATLQDWAWLLNVNVMGAVHGVMAFLPRMRAQQGEAHIVNTASIAGLVARPNQLGLYTTTKHALVGYTNVLRDELAAEGIGVSCWCPSGMLTEIFESTRRRQDRFGGASEPEPHPVPRRAGPTTPEAVAPRVLEGVRENLRYIFTHPDAWEDVEGAQRQVAADFEAARQIAHRVE